MLHDTLLDEHKTDVALRTHYSAFSHQMRDCKTWPLVVRCHRFYGLVGTCVQAWLFCFYFYERAAT